MADWSVEEEVAFQEVFAMYDDKGNGKIPVSKIGDVLRAYGQNPSLKDLTKLTAGLKSADQIDAEAAMSMAQKMKLNKVIKTSDIMQALKLFDKDGKGVFSAADLKNLLTQNGEKLTPAEVDQVLSGVGSSITCADFAKLISPVEKSSQ